MGFIYFDLINALHNWTKALNIYDNIYIPVYKETADTQKPIRLWISSVGIPRVGDLILGIANYDRILLQNMFYTSPQSTPYCQEASRLPYSQGPATLTL